MPSRPSVLTQFFTLLGLFVGGGLLGAWLAQWVAPESGFGSAISTLFLPAALFVGFFTWIGLAVISLPLVILRRLVHSPPAQRERPDSESAFVPPGSFGFLPVGILLGLVTGCLVGLIPGGVGPLTSMAAYGATGSLFGFAAWRLALVGWLPFPEE